MKFPSMKSNAKMFFAYFTVVLVAIVSLATVSAVAQKGDVAGGVSLEQCRNGGTIATAVPCDASSGGGSGWVTGNTGDSQAHWRETEYVPYRMLFTGLTPGATVHTVIIGYDILKSGVHAIDYLGTYDLTETVAMGNNPCDGVSGAHCSSFPAGASTVLIPSDQTLINTFPAPRPTMPLDGEMTLWGGTLIGCTYTTYGGGEERGLACTFTASVPNPVVAWSGHIAWQGEWGPGNSAGNITGSPYHMRLIDFDGSGGSMDRSLSAAAVAIPAKLTIIKDAVPVTGTTSTIEFDFTADAEFGPTAFTLIDNGIPGDDRQESGPISGFGVANAILVTELSKIGWDLDQVSCSGNSTAPSIDLNAGTANITLEEAETVECTFRNIQLTPSAAPADVSGRVATSGGRGISGAMVSIFNTATGESFTRMTNTFGYYRFNDLPVSDFYVMTVSHKRYLFIEASRSFTLEEDMFDVDFTASEGF